MNGLRLKHGMWVVVADGEKALFFRNEGDASYPNLSVVKEMRDTSLDELDDDTDQRGRFNNGPSPHKSAMEETDVQRVAKERFADDIAENLYKMAHRGDLDGVVLVAPPLVLGEMRKKLHKEVEQKVVGELPKTLTHHPVSEIEKILTAA